VKFNQAARPLAKRKFRKVRTWKGDRHLPKAECDIWRHLVTFAKSELRQQNWSAKLGGDEVHRMPSHLKPATSMCDQLYMDNLRPITRPAGQNLVFKGRAQIGAVKRPLFFQIDSKRIHIMHKA